MTRQYIKNGLELSNGEGFYKDFSNNSGANVNPGVVMALDITNYSALGSIPAIPQNSDTSRNLILGVATSKSYQAYTSTDDIPVCRDGFVMVNSAAHAVQGNPVTSDTAGLAYDGAGLALSSCFGVYLSSVAAAGLVPMWVRAIGKG